jgi:hypothetical protein
LCELAGYRREWSVAMDNGVDLPGYKCFVDPRTGARPDVFVAFLNISPAPGARVNGGLIEVSDDELAAFDRRERNYARVDVSDGVLGAAGRPIWARSSGRRRQASVARAGCTRVASSSRRPTTRPCDGRSRTPTPAGWVSSTG